MFNCFFRHKKKAQRPLTDEEYNAQRAEQRKELDRILDKISKKGIGKLTKKERRFLEENHHL